jgi:hypothetical protein
MSDDGEQAVHEQPSIRTAGLAASYRRILRLFPPRYRAEREEEMLAVLLDCAEPGRTTPSWADRVDLTRLGAAAWVRTALGPSPEARRDGAAVLAVLLPLLLLFPAGRIALAGAEARRYHVLRDYFLLAAWDWPAWLLWTVVAALVLVGLARWDRWPAIAAVSVYVAVLAHQLAAHNGTSFARASGWLLAQVVAAALLWSPVRAQRGTELVRARWRWAIAVGVAVLSIAAWQGVFLTGTTYLGPRGYGDAYRLAAGAVVVVGLGVGLAWLRRPAGRVVVPVVAACAAFGLAVRAWSSQLRDTDWRTSVSPDLHLGGLVLVAVAPVVAFLLVRIAGELLRRDRETGTTL